MKDIENWQINNGKLKRSFEFKTLEEAIDFINKCVPIISKMDHHPEWSNTYNKVDVSLITHSENSITEKDYTLAEKMNEIFEEI